MTEDNQNNGPSEFEQLETKEVGFFVELLDFLKHNKKWWLLPMLIVLLGLGGLIMLSGTAAAPFIYTLF